MPEEVFTSSSNWTVPADITWAAFHVWGSGGHGGEGDMLAGGHGGGGGAYATKFLAVTGNDLYDITIGTSDEDGSPGTATEVRLDGAGSADVSADYGLKGEIGGGGGAGGLAANSIGDTKYNGGTGSAGDALIDGGEGGGGGGCAGHYGAGGNGAVTAGGTAGAGGGTGGAGGNGGSGAAGSTPGGAGGGGASDGVSGYSGGAGTSGKVIIVYAALSDCTTVLHG